ncbi:hypothetical protein J3459_010410 [Metarhizium acridum]|uniref:uncharacterized protein n=1 Tax=Metarhizium acridum TaxID=92637 RepID=UPI001C6BD79F|nr:hypothetical protein J3458_020699 [Metarhizium acridum]KAG8422432.1 hypothetical protein J3459_010410 [Metarhizium acridum]
MMKMGSGLAHWTAKMILYASLVVICETDIDIRGQVSTQYDWANLGRVGVCRCLEHTNGDICHHSSGKQHGKALDKELAEDGGSEYDERPQHHELAPNTLGEINIQKDTNGVAESAGYAKESLPCCCYLVIIPERLSKLSLKGRFGIEGGCEGCVISIHDNA